MSAEGGARLVENTGAQQHLRIHDAHLTSGSIRIFSASELDREYSDRVSADNDGGLLRVRSVREFALAPVLPGAKLIERADAQGHALPGWGAVRSTDAGLLGELLNTGWVAPLPDGGAVFAWALDPEVLRFDAAGRRIWRSVRSTRGQRRTPVLVRDGASIRPDFVEAQHGVAAGPDGRIYVLAAASPDSVGLDVLDRDGVFVRVARLPRGRDIFADAQGRVSIGPAADTRSAQERITFPDIDLPSLNGNSRITLAEHHGKVVVINVWASWCAPCRKEMPALDSLAAEIAGDDVVVLGLNDDEVVSAAQRFLASLGGVSYPLAAGEGRLRERLGYRGLPYTVVLDREHRVVEEIHGFGGTLEPIRQAIDTALAAHAVSRTP